MKKVLALVLAAIMVCTMAFAVTTSGVTTAGDSTVDATQMTQLVPGDSIVLSYGDLGIASGEDHAKYTVTVKATGPITSQGWVNDKTAGYVYVLNTAADETKVIDGNPDIVIESIVVKKVRQAADVMNVEYTKVENGVTKYVATTTGVELIATDTSKAVWKTIDELKAQSDVSAKMAFDLGRVVSATAAKAEIAADGKSVAVTVPAKNNNYLVSVVRLGTKNTATFVATTTDMAASVVLTHGEKVIVSTPTTVAILNSSKLTDNLVANGAAIKAELSNKMVVNKVMTITADNCKDGYKMYLVNSDGTVRDLGATFDSNKVLTATAKITGPVIVTDKAITATAASTGSTGTTTNPETGANDVIGVAAALAVVALVSGAAISLKK